MLTGYFDETGHTDDPTLHFVGMAGFIAPSEAWINFESEWQDTLRKAGLKEAFHMKDFAHSAGQFAEWKGQEEKPQLLFGRLVEIIRKTNAKPIGAAVSLRDYKTLTEVQRSQFRDPYYLVFQVCTRGAADRAVFELPGERVATVYAFNGEYGTNKGGQAETLWHAIRENYANGVRLGAYASRSPNELCPLQAADLFAYELCHEFENRIKRPDHPMRWGLRQILKMYNIPIPTIRLFDRKELLRTIREGNFPDQSGVEELSSKQMSSAMEAMMHWLSERGEYERD
jgi:hypothetical protein